MAGMAGMAGSSPSPSMFQPQPTMGGMSTPSSLLPQPQQSTPSPSPYPQSQMLQQTGLGIQPPFGQSSFAQQMLPPQAQGSPMIPTQPAPQSSPMVSFQQPLQGSPMMPPQQMQMQMQPSPMFQQQQMPMQMQQMGGAGAFGAPQMGAFGSPMPQSFMPMGSPSPASFAQQPQQPMFAQSAFGGTGWQQPGYAGQQQWSGM